MATMLRRWKERSGKVISNEADEIRTATISGAQGFRSNLPDRLRMMLHGSDKGVIRFLTCGSVDDGKSTL